MKKIKIENLFFFLYICFYTLLGTFNMKNSEIIQIINEHCCFSPTYERHLQPLLNAIKEIINKQRKIDGYSTTKYCHNYKYIGGYIYMNGVKHAVVVKTENRKKEEKHVTILTAELLGMSINGKKIEVEYTLLDEKGNCA